MSRGRRRPHPGWQQLFLRVALFRKILLPIDVAEPEIAKEAIEAATALAKAFDSQLRLIHVTSPVVVASPMAVIPQAVYDELGVYEKSELQRLAAPIDLPKATISTVVRIGAVYPELLSEAEDWGRISSSWALTSARWRPTFWAPAPPPSSATPPAR